MKKHILQFMDYDYTEKRIIAVIDKDLPVGLAMNALGHLAFSAGNKTDNSWQGKEEIIDSDNFIHKGISKYPFIALKASKDEIKYIIHEARKKPGILMIDFTKEMFDTDTDDSLVNELKKAKESLIQYQAVILAGSSKILKTLTGHLKLYK